MVTGSTELETFRAGNSEIIWFSIFSGTRKLRPKKTAQHLSPRYKAGRGSTQARARSFHSVLSSLKPKGAGRRVHSSTGCNFSTGTVSLSVCINNSFKLTQQCGKSRDCNSILPPCGLTRGPLQATQEHLPGKQRISKALAHCSPELPALLPIPVNLKSS